jgi:hypothetical protein
MAFSDFKYPAVLGELGLTETSVLDLFGHAPPVPASASLVGTLPSNVRLASGAHTEFSRSVWLVGPVLSEVWGRYNGRICLIGGAEFTADAAAKLTGVCDFLFGRYPQVSHVKAPAIVLFEAKRDSIPDGLGQCIAAMVGAQRFNRNEGHPIETVYGCVTTGVNWKFLTLTGTVVTLDQTEYSVHEVDRILGILVHMIGPIPA